MPMMLRGQPKNARIFSRSGVKRRLAQGCDSAINLLDTQGLPSYPPQSEKRALSVRRVLFTLTKKEERPCLEEPDMRLSCFWQLSSQRTYLLRDDADYPTKPITTLMGFAPGGGSDVMLSMVRPHLEKAMKTTFVPVYKPGSGSDIALTELAMSKPDGYTVVISCTPSGSHQRRTSGKPPTRSPTSPLSPTSSRTPASSWSGRKAPIRRSPTSSRRPRRNREPSAWASLRPPGTTGSRCTCSKGRRRSNSTSSPSRETAPPGRPRWPATSTPPPTTWASSTPRSGRASSAPWRS